MTETEDRAFHFILACS